MFSNILKKKDVDQENKEARTRALETINGSWTRPKENDEYGHTKYPMSDMPTKLSGGQINLIRAMADTIDDDIENIVVEMEELETRKKFLIAQKALHEDMKSVLLKHGQYTPLVEG